MANIINPLPYNIVAGQAVSAAPVMANFNEIFNDVNNNAAALASANVFTQPQTVPQAVSANQAVTLAQVQALILSALPTGSLLPYAGATAPSGYLLCDGSAYSRTTYANLFSAIGTTWGAGDGLTTFNVPDSRRRAIIGSGGTVVSGLVSNTTGSVGGEELHTTVVAEMPTHNHGITDPGHNHTVTNPSHNHTLNDPSHYHAVTDPGHYHIVPMSNTGNLGTSGAMHSDNQSSSENTATAYTGLTVNASLTGITLSAATQNTSLSSATTGITTNNNGSGAGHNTMQPSMVVTMCIKF
jgi:microcystin-dependent protein